MLGALRTRLGPARDVQNTRRQPQDAQKDRESSQTGPHIDQNARTKNAKKPLVLYLFWAAKPFKKRFPRSWCGADATGKRLEAS